MPVTRPRCLFCGERLTPLRRLPLVRMPREQKAFHSVCGRCGYQQPPGVDERTATTAAADLRRWTAMRDRGLLSAAEFASLESRLIERLWSSTTGPSDPAI